MKEKGSGKDTGKGVEGERRKISIRFFNDREVRAVWDESADKWWFCAVDVVSALSGSGDARNYWYVLKNRLKKAGDEVLTKCKGFKLLAPDGKRRMTDCFDASGIVELAKRFPGNKATPFLDWFLYSDNTIDGKSKQKAYQLFESGLLESVEVGTAKGLRQIHAYLFGGLCDSAGQIRTVNIAKDGFAFAPAHFLEETLARIEAMPETDFDAIAAKYVEMNIAHPFREGNGRATRIWLDRMLAVRLGLCVDWSRIDKRSYLDAMRRSVSDASAICGLLRNALTDRIGDRETFMKGIDYSYYYEEQEGGA